MKTLVVLWYGGGSSLSRLIQWVTKSTFSHTAIMIDGVLYEALGRGVRRLEGVEAEQRAREAIAHVDLPVHKSDHQQVVRWLEYQVGKGYSVLGFLMAGVQTLTGNAVVISLVGEYICSGLVARALQLAGYLYDAEARLATPASLAVELDPSNIPYNKPDLPSMSELEDQAERQVVDIHEEG